MEKRRKYHFQDLLRDPLSLEYEFINEIGEGCFGKIYKVRNRNSDIVSALKIERSKKSKVMLGNEIKILEILQGKLGVPCLYNNGFCKNGRWMQIQLLSTDLNQESHKYSFDEIVDLTLKMLKILKGIHDIGIIHQDIKPHNIMKNQKGNIYLVDYGLSKILSSSTKVKGFLGTPRYASLRAHELLPQGKSDDLESLFYNIAYLYFKRLPWSKLKVPTLQKLQKIKYLKLQHRNDLFAKMGSCFQNAFHYIINLKTQEPDYKVLKGFFKRSRSIMHEISKIPYPKRLSLEHNTFLLPPLINTKNEEISLGGSIQSSLNDFYSNRVFIENLSDSGEVIEQCNEANIIQDISKYVRPLVLKNPFR